MYSEDYKTLMKKLKVTPMEGYNVLLDWKNIDKIPMLLKEVCSFNAIPNTNNFQVCYWNTKDSK